MNWTIIALVAAALIIGVILFLIIHFIPLRQLDKEKYQSRWLDIEQNLKIDNTDSRCMAILKADKLLDQALKDTGSKGETMGERMKARQGVWSNTNAVWAAHKVRNKIAHEEQVSISEDMTKRVLASFKRALKDLGAM